MLRDRQRKAVADGHLRMIGQLVQRLRDRPFAGILDRYDGQRPPRAARRAALDPDAAALASAAAAKIHGLAILRKNIQDSAENVTRFFTITTSKTPVRAVGKAKERRSLIYLVIGNRPGALLHVLAPFDASEVNLTFIQSRPLSGRPWEYGFFIEAATDWKSARAQAAWKLVLALAESGRKIGTYPVS